MGFPIRLAINSIMHELPTLNQIINFFSSFVFLCIIDSEFTVLAIIDTSILFRASGAPAFVEVNIQVQYYYINIKLSHHKIII